MSQLTPKKVKEHLEKLGYTNIPKKELQVFTRDLQRLVNYETSSRSGTEHSTYSHSQGRRGDCRRHRRSELESIPEDRSQATTQRSRCRSQFSRGWDTRPPPAGTSDFFDLTGTRCRPRARSVDTRSDSLGSLEETMRELAGADDAASSVTDSSVGAPVPAAAATRQEWLPQVRDGAEELLKAGFRVRCDMLTKPIRSSPASRHRWYEEVWKRNPVPTEDSHYNIRSAVRFALDTYDFKPRPMPKPTDVWQGPLLRTQPDASYKMNYDNALNRFPLNVREGKKNCQ
ncbi:hypothetical protein FJT64_008250 [Amphibalanus amphitrite]|uniref:LEM domain-containing protein n=1 Tax=Amphibalanus amphitrite TaxID=1232801 RepID=A0A6A4VCG8_AMPAM|nr:hypothetical protein FJT64_008250 [Amphibalanus amphitrite]